MDLKDRFMQFIGAASDIVYGKERIPKLLKMMGTQQGTIIAAHTVMGAIDKQQPIPPELAPVLAVVIMMMLVDVAKESLETQPSQKVLNETIKMLMDDAHKTYPPGKAATPKTQGLMQQPAAQPAQRPTGLINQGAPA